MFLTDFIINLTIAIAPVIFVFMLIFLIMNLFKTLANLIGRGF